MENNRLPNLQKIIMNNDVPNLSVDLDYNFLYNNLNNLDENMLKIMNNKIINPYQCKLNLLNYILKNGENIIIKNRIDIKKFFNTLNPLNNFYELGSFEWQFDDLEIDNKKFLLVKNSVLKENMIDDFYVNYIDQIKKIFINNKLDFTYEEFKTPRFYKSVDIIFIIKDNNQSN